MMKTMIVLMMIDDENDDCIDDDDDANDDCIDDDDDENDDCIDDDDDDDGDCDIDKDDSYDYSVNYNVDGDDDIPVTADNGICPCKTSCDFIILCFVILRDSLSII